MLRLNEFRHRAYGLPDLLPWAALVDNGIVLTKAGALLAGWSFSGPDLDSATPVELSAMAARINRVLMLGDGWVIHCDAIRAPAPGYAPAGHFPDRTSMLIDDTRRAAYLQTQVGYTCRYVICVTWFPEPDVANRAAQLFVEGRAQGTAARNLERFRDSIRELEGRLSGFMRIERLADTTDEDGTTTSALLGHLEQCVLPGLPFRPRVLPEIPVYLDAVLGQHDFTTGFVPHVDGRGIACLAISGLPARSRPGILDFLSRLPVAYRWSNRFICMDEQKASKELNRYRSRWAQKRKSALNVMREAAGGQATHMDADAVGMAEDAVHALAENASGQVQFGYYTSVLLLSHEDPAVLDEISREVGRVISNKGFGARLETVNAVEAYLGTIAGNTWANVRRPLIHTLNLAHLLPFTAVWAGPDTNPCPFYEPDSPPLLYVRTDGSTPFRLCLHAGDLGHTLVVGPTGSGKSTILGMVAAQQLRYRRAQVFVFDKGYSMQPLVWGCGAEHYDIAGDDNAALAFCPLGRIDDEPERDWAAEWLEGMAQLQGVEIKPAHRQRIYEAITALANSTTRMEERTLTDFLMKLQDMELREALTAYSLQGTGGRLLDARSDALREDRFQVFELEHLMNKGEKQLLPTLLYLFHRLEQRFDGSPTLLLLDEAWVMLGHPGFRQKIVEWLKVLRKRNACVVFSTQSLADLQRSGIADVVFESCPTKILLANPSAATENVRPLYERMGLNSRQIDIVSMATPKRDYYMVHPDGRRQFQLGLSGVELAFVGASGREDLARIRALRDELGDAWPAQWLRERGETAAAARWETCA